MANWVLAGANHTRALSVHNSVSLTATELMSKETEASGLEAAAAGSDMLKTGSNQLKENTVNLNTGSEEVSWYEESRDQTQTNQ